MPNCFFNPYAIELTTNGVIHLDVDRGIAYTSAKANTTAYHRMSMRGTQLLITSLEQVIAARMADCDSALYIDTSECSVVPCDDAIDLNLLALSATEAYFEVPQWVEGLVLQEFIDVFDEIRQLPRAVAVPIAKLGAFKFNQACRSLKARVVFNVQRVSYLPKTLPANYQVSTQSIFFMPETEWQSLPATQKVFRNSALAGGNYYLQNLDELRAGQTYLIEHVHELAAIEVFEHEGQKVFQFYSEHDNVRSPEYSPKTRHVYMITQAPIRPLHELFPTFSTTPRLSLDHMVKLCNMPIGSMLTVGDAQWQLMPVSEMLKRKDILETHPEYSKDLFVCSQHQQHSAGSAGAYRLNGRGVRTEGSQQPPLSGWGLTLVDGLLPSSDKIPEDCVLVTQSQTYQQSRSGNPLVKLLQLYLDEPETPARYQALMSYITVNNSLPKKFSDKMRSVVKHAVLNPRKPDSLERVVEATRLALMTKSNNTPFWRCGAVDTDHI